MRHFYTGYPYGKIYYATDEEREAILNGEIFQTNDFSWYFKSIPYDVCAGYQVPEDFVNLELDCTTSKYTKQWRYFQLVRDPNAKVYYDEKLRNKIFADLKLWMRDINAKLRAFSGKSFISYINALPERFLIDENFIVTAKFVVKSELDARVAKRRMGKIMATGISKMASQALDQAHSKVAGEFEVVAQRVAETEQVFDDAHEKAALNASKAAGKGGKA